MDSTHFRKTEIAAPLVLQIAELKKQIALAQGQVDAMVEAVASGATSRTLLTQLDLGEKNIDALEADLREAEVALEQARGHVSPAEHIQRVLEIRNAIDSQDAETARQARRIIRSAFQAVIERIEFSGWKASGRKYSRSIYMRLAGGHVMIWFDGDGNVVRKRDHLNDFINDPNGRLSQLMIEVSGGVGVDALNAQARRKWQMIV